MEVQIQEILLEFSPDKLEMLAAWLVRMMRPGAERSAWQIVQLVVSQLVNT